MEKSEQINELAKALSAAQGEIVGAAKDTENTFFHSSYADLQSVWDAIRPALSKHSLAVVQGAGSDNGSAVVTTLLMHSSGQWVQDRLVMTPTKHDPQAMGSAITYARRYALMAMVGIAPVDDDGNSVSGNEGEPKKKQKAPQPRQGPQRPQETHPSPAAKALAAIATKASCHDLDLLHAKLVIEFNNDPAVMKQIEAKCRDKRHEILLSAIQKADAATLRRMVAEYIPKFQFTPQQTEEQAAIIERREAQLAGEA